MDYFSAIKSDKILMQTTAWMKSPGNHTEWKKQSPRVTHCMVLFLGHSLKDRATGLGNRSVVARGQGGCNYKGGAWGREWGLPGDPVAKTPHSQCGGSLVRELDPTCCNKDQA